MKTFEEFVTDWWEDYLSEADENTHKALMGNLIGEEETIENYIPEDADSPYDWLLANMTADEIYDKYFSFQNDGKGLAGTCDAQQSLELVAFFESFYEGFYSGRLVAGRSVF